MKKQLLINLAIGVASIALGYITACAIDKRKAKSKTPTNMFAGNIMCVPNKETQETDLYLQITADISDIMDMDSVTFKVVKKEVKINGKPDVPKA